MLSAFTPHPLFLMHTTPSIVFTNWPPRTIPFDSQWGHMQQVWLYRRRWDRKAMRNAGFGLWGPRMSFQHCKKLGNLMEILRDTLSAWLGITNTLFSGTWLHCDFTSHRILSLQLRGIQQRKELQRELLSLLFRSWADSVSENCVTATAGR